MTESAFRFLLSIYIWIDVLWSDMARLIGVAEKSTAFFSGSRCRSLRQHCFLIQKDAENHCHPRRRRHEVHCGQSNFLLYVEPKEVSLGEHKQNLK